MESKEGGLFSHDPAIFYDKEQGYFYTYSTDAGPNIKKRVGGQIRRSKDLINFEYIGTALKDGKMPEEVVRHTKAATVWAPDIIKYEKEYRLYYSASTFGSQYSAIGLAVSSSPEGPFEHRGIVIETTPESPVNAIDANPVIEEETGDHYMVYGSFWGGIRILKLDKETGLAAEEGYGVSIARRSKLANTAIEGAYVKYHKETGYYYLFVSYDSLANLYNVRVARSKCIKGPYLDYHGVAMTDLSLPPNHVGLKITTGYSFSSGTGFLALGHNSVLNYKDEWFLICHARYEKDPRLHCLNVRKMLFTEDGWPLVSPSLYSGEKVEEIKETKIKEVVCGEYLRIDFMQDVYKLCETPVPMLLYSDGTVKLPGIRGHWEFDGMYSQVKIIYNGVREIYYILPGFDRENNRTTYVMTGMNNNGNCIWCKKVESGLTE